MLNITTTSLFRGLGLNLVHVVGSQSTHTPLKQRARKYYKARVGAAASSACPPVAQRPLSQHHLHVSQRRRLVRASHGVKAIGSRPGAQRMWKTGATKAWINCVSRCLDHVAEEHGRGARLEAEGGAAATVGLGINFLISTYLCYSTRRRYPHSSCNSTLGVSIVPIKFSQLLYPIIRLTNGHSLYIRFVAATKVHICWIPVITFLKVILILCNL